MPPLIRFTYAAVLGLVLTLVGSPALAQESPDSLDTLPGVVEGIGTEFVVTEGDSINITITTTDSVQVIIHNVSSLSLN
jgi:hypothetical protein